MRNRNSNNSMLRTANRRRGCSAFCKGDHNSRIVSFRVESARHASSGNARSVVQEVGRSQGTFASGRIFGQPTYDRLGYASADPLSRAYTFDNHIDPLSLTSQNSRKTPQTSTAIPIRRGDTLYVVCKTIETKHMTKERPK